MVRGFHSIIAIYVKVFLGRLQGHWIGFKNNEMDMYLEAMGLDGYMGIGKKWKAIDDLCALFAGGNILILIGILKY